MDDVSLYEACLLGATALRFKLADSPDRADAEKCRRAAEVLDEYASLIVLRPKKQRR